MLIDHFTPGGFAVMTHVPDAPGPLEVLVAVHGISRNAEEIFDAFVDAVGSRMIVVAPLFDSADFPDYQRLGLSGRGKRADLLLETALEHLAASSARSFRRIHLFGFSGGAQFAHRYTLLYPDRIASLHVASAGWYTFPDPQVRWPYGLGQMKALRPVADRLPHFHAIPKTIYVGDRDTERDDALRKGRDIDRQQGLTRVERAHRWAAAVGCSDVVTLRGAGHSFDDCCKAGREGLAQLVTQRIIGSPGGTRRDETEDVSRFARAAATG